MLIDTHTHVYAPEFDHDLSDVMARAAEAGVEAMVLPNIDVESLPRMEALMADYPTVVHPAWGLHPTSVTPDWAAQWAAIRACHERYGGVAIGEIGLDFYWDEQYAAEQEAAFVCQLQYAQAHDLPVIIHQRSAYAAVMSALRQVDLARLDGVFHSFAGTAEELDEILTQTRMMVGINGIVTFKNARLRELLPLIPANRLLIETDAPYLSPVPHRGKRNEPSFLVHTAAHIAHYLEVSLETLARQTTQNARHLFRF